MKNNRLFKKEKFNSQDIAPTIRKNVLIELTHMAHTAQNPAGNKTLTTIIKQWDTSLARLENILKNKLIDLNAEICLSENTLPKTFSNKVLRIGVYPISANPLHWGHLLIGISAIVTHKLDKVVFIIAGEDPKKPNLAPQEWRHAISKKVLNKFYPLFAYSDIAKNGKFDGEINIFRILELNPFQKIDAFYIAGTDHCYRVNPKKGDKDTIQKLEENIANKICHYNTIAHSISVIFVGREGGSNQAVNTTLNIEFIPQLEFQASSTMIRDALTEMGKKEDLTLLPFTIFKNIFEQENHLPKTLPSNKDNFLPQISS